MATTYTHIASNKRKSVALIIIFILLIIAIGYFFAYFTEAGPVALPIAIIFSVVSAVAGYYGSDKIALAVSGAKEVKKEQAPELINIIDNLAITAGTPAPKVYLMPHPAINAFATGRDPKHASVAVTRGALEKLSRVELEGVLAHELSHIKNYDIRLMTLVVVFVGIIALLSDWFIRIRFWGGGRRDSREGGQLGAILMIVGLVLIILSPIIAKLIQLAISRKREFLADSSAALLTRYPEGLASALEKIKQDPSIIPSANHATAHLFISSPFKKSGAWLNKLFSTHPPLDERIKKLRTMAH